MPDRTPVEALIEMPPGRPVAEYVSVSPSASLALASSPVGVTPSASVRSVRSVEKTGAALTLVTVQVNASVSVSVPSDTVIVTLWTPELVGLRVPDRTPVEALIEMPPGRPVAEYVSVSPSASLALASSPVGVTPSASLRSVRSVEKTGAALTLVTVQVNVSVALAVPSDTVRITLWTPELEPSSVPERRPVEALIVMPDGSPVAL